MIQFGGWTPQGLDMLATGNFPNPVGQMNVPPGFKVQNGYFKPTTYQSQRAGITDFQSSAMPFLQKSVFPQIDKLLFPQQQAQPAQQFGFNKMIAPGPQQTQIPQPFDFGKMIADLQFARPQARQPLFAGAMGMGGGGYGGSMSNPLQGLFGGGTSSPGYDYNRPLSEILKGIL